MQPDFCEKCVPFSGNPYKMKGNIRKDVTGIFRIRKEADCAGCLLTPECPENFLLYAPPEAGHTTDIIRLKSQSQDIMVPAERGPLYPVLQDGKAEYTAASETRD